MNTFGFLISLIKKDVNMNTRNQKKEIMQKGFTLIELMVVIVIIGILSALAIPKMFGVSAKAKAAEAPGVIANYETLTSAYAQETGAAGPAANIGFQNPGTSSKWFTYADATPGHIIATTRSAFGDCAALVTWTSGAYAVATDSYPNRLRPAGSCGSYTPNFGTAAP